MDELGPTPKTPMRSWSDQPSQPSPPDPNRTWSEQPPQPPGVHWSQALTSAALAGVLLAVALTLPFASRLLLMVASGGLVVALYAKRSASPVTRRLGVRLGLLGGLFSWAIMVAVLAMEIAFGGGDLISTLRDALQQQIANSSDPRAQEILAKLNSPGGMTALLAVGVLLFLIFVLFAGGVGGALAASLFGKSKRKDE